MTRAMTATLPSVLLMAILVLGCGGSTPPAANADPAPVATNDASAIAAVNTAAVEVVYFYLPG